MRIRCWLFVLLILATGCASQQKAHEMADQAMYKPIEYENAAQQGTLVVVLPGEIKSTNASFMTKIGSTNIKDFLEIELSKDNFEVIDRAESLPMFNEIALAANMGDADALRLFRKDRMKTANWFVACDILKAEPVAFDNKGFDGQALGTVIQIVGSLAGSGGSETLTNMLGTAVSSIKTSNTKATWLVGMKYRVINAHTGEMLCANYIEDTVDATTDSTSVMGVGQQEKQYFTLDTMTQRLIQKAVQEVDKNLKSQMAAYAPEPEKKKAKVDPKKEKALLADYKAKVEAEAQKKKYEAAVNTLRCSFYAYSNLNGGEFLSVYQKDLHPDIVKKMGMMFQFAEKNPKWRDTLQIDVSKLEYQVVSMDNDACKIKVSGPLGFTVQGKDMGSQQEETYEMKREEDGWKVCTLAVAEAKKKTAQN